MEQNSHYKLGTIYTHTDGRTGIVVDVDEDNQPTLLLALRNTLCGKVDSCNHNFGPTWYDAVEDFDELKNPNWDLYKGELRFEKGFHLPTKEEFEKIGNNWKQLESCIEKLASEGKCDGLKTKDGGYFTWLWSSTQEDDEYAYCLATFNGYAHCILKCDTNLCNRVRGVAVL